MKYKIKVGNKYLVGESANETLKGTVRGDTTSVYSRFVGEMSAYDFCDNIEDADAKDVVTACEYVRGIMERQKCGFYLGEIKLVNADAEETVVHCKKNENATLIAMILDADAEGKVWALDLYENHIEPPKEISVRERAWELAQEISHLVDSTLKWYEVKGLVGKRAAELANDCCDYKPPKEVSVNAVD